MLNYGNMDIVESDNMSEEELRNLESKYYIIDDAFTLDDLDTTKLEVSTSSLGQTNRQDKDIVVTDKLGQTKKVSSIMMGYNKKGITLSDGTFVNSDDLLNHMNNAINRLDEGEYIVSKKGIYLDPQALLELAYETAGKITYGERSTKVVNQDSRDMAVLGPNKEMVSKGISFIGNDGLRLESGDYVSLDAFVNALSEYVVVKKKPITESNDKDKTNGNNDNKEKEEKEIIVRVVKKYKDKLNKWLCMLGMTAVMLSGIESVEAIVDTTDLKITELDDSYTVEFQIGNEVYKDECKKDTVNRLQENLKMGDMVNVNDGESFNYNGLLTGSEKTMGEEFSKENKFAGSYPVTGFSISDKSGNHLAFIEDFDNKKEGIDLQEFINKTLLDNNMFLEDVNISIHMGSNKGDRLGWININDLINEDTISEDDVMKVLAGIENETGMEVFNGSTITLEDGTIIKVIDESGNMLRNGERVVGSDGNEYIINSLELEKTNNNIINIISGSKNSKINWDVKNCNLLYAILPGVLAIVNNINKKKKNEKSNEEPTFLEFENMEEYDKFLEEFEKAKENYNKNSSFGTMLKRVFYEEREDTLQKLNEEQKNILYQIILKHNNKDYYINNIEQIEINNGRILIKNEDNSIKDITDIVMSEINHLGEENTVVATGILEEQNGIQR